VLAVYGKSLPLPLFAFGLIVSGRWACSRRDVLITTRCLMTFGFLLTGMPGRSLSRGARICVSLVAALGFFLVYNIILLFSLILYLYFSAILLLEPASVFLKEDIFPECRRSTTKKNPKIRRGDSPESARSKPAPPNPAFRYGTEHGFTTTRHIKRPPPPPLFQFPSSPRLGCGSPAPSFPFLSLSSNETTKSNRKAQRGRRRDLSARFHRALRARVLRGGTRPSSSFIHLACCRSRAEISARRGVARVPAPSVRRPAGRPQETSCGTARWQIHPA